LKYACLAALALLLAFSFHFSFAGSKKPDTSGITIPRLYVCDQEQSRIVIIDPETGEVLGAIKTPKAPATIVRSQSGHRIFVTHPDSGELSVVDTHANKLLHSELVSGEPFGVASIDDDTIAYSDWKSGFVKKYKIANAEISPQIYVGHSPAHIVHDESRKRLYVVLREDNELAVIDESSFSIISKIAVGQAPFALAFDPNGTRILVANVRSGTLSIIDADKLTLTTTIDAGKSPYGIAIDARDETIVVTNQDENSISIFDANLNQKRKLSIGRFPEGVAVDPDHDLAYVSNWFSGEISIIDLKTQKQIKAIKIGGAPRTLVLIDP